MLLCSDKSYYIGSTSHLENRLAQHQAGVDPKSYTASRRPVELVWCHECSTHADAFRLERQIKGWSRAKKEALIHEDFAANHEIVREQWLKREAAKKTLSS
jgi:predicted GIY-YIG superfamily endonuclease